MKERSKERLASLLMEELLEQLAERENIKRMFAEMTSAPMDELLESLLDEFERIVEKHHRLILDAKKAAREKRGRKRSDLTAETLPVEGVPAGVLPPTESRPPEFPTPASVAGPDGVVGEPATPLSASKVAGVTEPAQLKLDAFPIDLPSPTIDIPEVPDSSSVRRTESERPKVEKRPRVTPPAENDPMAELRKLEEVARKVEVEYKAKMEALAAQQREAVDVAVGDGHDVSPDIPGESIEKKGRTLEIGAGRLQPGHPFEPYTFGDDEYAYLHGVALVPEGEEPAATAFLLNEKGIDSRGFIFATDYEGMRFYLSKINPSVLNISKSMMLLLAKQESLQLRATHQNIINDLREYGLVLPFEFGSVVRGADDLLSKVDKRIVELKEALEDLRATTWWTLNLLVLDARIASLTGTETSATLKSRERIRQSHTPVIQPKYNIKTLEKILQKEKKIAEAVHQELSGIADRSDVESMVGLGSGSTDDWKSILRASYEVQASALPRLFRTVSDLQYQHVILELMFALTGNRDQFSLRPS